MRRRILQIVGTAAILGMLYPVWIEAGRRRSVCGDGNIQGNEVCERPGQRSTCEVGQLCDRTCLACRQPILDTAEGRDCFRLCLDRGYEGGVNDYACRCNDGFLVRTHSVDPEWWPRFGGPMCGEEWWGVRRWFTTPWTCEVAERVCREEGHGGVRSSFGESSFLCGDGRRFSTKGPSGGRPAVPFSDFHCACGDPANCGIGNRADCTACVGPTEGCFTADGRLAGEGESGWVCVDQRCGPS